MYNETLGMIRETARDLPYMLANKGVLLIDFTIWEPEGFFHSLIAPLLSSGRRVKLGMVRFSNPVTRIDMTKTFDENIGSAKLLDPKEYTARENKLLAELGEEDPDLGHLYGRSHTTFRDLLRQMVKTEVEKESSGERLSLLKIAMGILESL